MRGNGQVAIFARGGRTLVPSVRRLVWFLVVTGLTGLAGLAVLRVPLTVHVAYITFFAFAALVVWNDTRSTKESLEGELLLSVPARELRHIRGLNYIPWKQLLLPRHGVLVLATRTEWDAKRWFGGLGRPCQLLVLPADPGRANWIEHAWESATEDRLPEGTVTIVDTTHYEIARGLSEMVAKAMGWPTFDLTASQPERRLPEDLDRPFVRRKQAILDTLPASAGRRPWGATAHADGETVEIALRTTSLFRLVVEVVLVGPLLALLFVISGGNWGLPLLGVLMMVFTFGGRTHIELTPQRAIFRTVSVWLPLGQEQILAWDQIEQIQVLTERGRCGIRFVGDSASVFAPSPGRKAAQWAGAEIRRYLIAQAANATPIELSENQRVKRPVTNVDSLD